MTLSFRLLCWRCGLVTVQIRLSSGFESALPLFTLVLLSFLYLFYFLIITLLFCCLFDSTRFYFDSTPVTDGQGHCQLTAPLLLLQWSKSSMCSVLVFTKRKSVYEL